MTEAKPSRPEIVRVFLFGSLAQGTWTADSDADLIVVVLKELTDFSSRSPFHIFAEGIVTDSLVYSESESEKQVISFRRSSYKNSVASSRGVDWSCTRLK